MIAASRAPVAEAPVAEMPAPDDDDEVDLLFEEDFDDTDEELDLE